MGRPRFSRALTLPLEPRHLAAQVHDLTMFLWGVFAYENGVFLIAFSDPFWLDPFEQ